MALHPLHANQEGHLAKPIYLAQIGKFLVSRNSSSDRIPAQAQVARITARSPITPAAYRIICQLCFCHHLCPIDAEHLNQGQARTGSDSQLGRKLPPCASTHFLPEVLHNPHFCQFMGSVHGGLEKDQTYGTLAEEPYLLYLIDFYIQEGLQEGKTSI